MAGALWVLLACTLVTVHGIHVVDKSFHAHTQGRGAMEPTRIEFANDGFSKPDVFAADDSVAYHEKEQRAQQQALDSAAVEFPRFASVSTNGTGTAVDYSEGCMDIPFAVCVGSVELGGITPIAAEASLKGLVGKWDFNDHAAQDSSGHMNSPKPIPTFGPGYNPSGSSAHLSGKEAIAIDHQPAYSSSDLTVMFWIFVIDDVFGGYHTILHKGANKDQGAPSIQLIPDTRVLHISVATVKGESTFDSKGHLPLNRWTHVAFVQDHRLLALYINGILDNEHIVPEPGVIPNKGSLFIGKDPWRPGVHCYLDDLAVFDRAVAGQDLSAIGWAAYPGIGADFVRLGCLDCSPSQARDACANMDNRHLCYKHELAQGALRVAGAQGWVKLVGSHFWHPGSKVEDNANNLQPVGLCCRN